jgi:hypothetical protein
VPARRALFRIALVAAASAAACATPRSAAVLVERQLVSLDLLVDGSVEVREELLVRFVGAPVSTFERRIPGDRLDGFIDVRGTGDPAIDRDGGLRARWTFPPTADSTRTFVLEYRAVGATSLYGANALLYWPVVPLRPAYPVASSEVRLTVPRAAVFMTPPAIDATAAWVLLPGDAAFAASRDGLPPDEHAALIARLAADTLALAKPDWQYDAELAQQLTPAFASAGIVIVVVGVGVLWMLRLQYRRQAAVGALASAAPLPDEQFLVDERWRAKGEGRRTLAELLASLGSARGRTRRVLLEDLQTAGLVDSERRSVADGLTGAGWVVIGLGALCAAAAAVVLGRYGPWTQAIPAGIVVVGVMFVAAGARFGILTPRGEQLARQYTSRL